MKKIFKKIHHFTRFELAIEEIIIIIIICVLCSAALAAKALLPIRAGIVQCGSKAELSESCRRDARCCGLMENSGASSGPPENQMQETNAADEDPSLQTVDENGPFITVE